MLSQSRRRDLFTRADAFASRLVAAGVTRAELRPVLNALFLPPQPWPKRLEATRRLAGALPGSWVGDRSNRTRGQLLAVQRALQEILGNHKTEEELRFLLGWVARLVHVRAMRRTERHGGHGPGREVRDDRRRPGGRDR